MSTHAKVDLPSVNDPEENTPLLARHILVSQPLSFWVWGDSITSDPVSPCEVALKCQM